MDYKKVEKIAAKIQAKIFKKSNATTLGGFKSQFRGSGLQFKEHQVYTHGDEVRFIDWKLSAKTNTTYIKTFEEERNIEIVLFLDLSRSMLMGHKEIAKLTAALEVTCLFYLLAEESKDKVKVVLLADELIELKASSGKKGMSYLLNYLNEIGLLSAEAKVNLTYKPKKNINEEDLKKKMKSFLMKKKEIVLLSDFNFLEDIKFFERLLANRSVHFFRIQSPLDESSSLPFYIKVQDLKTDKSSFTLGHVNHLGKEKFKNFKKLDISKDYLEQLGKYL